MKYTLLFENEFAEIHYYSQIHTIGHIWFSESTHLLFGKEYQEQIDILLDFSKKYKPTSLLLDLSLGKFTIDLESQKWLQEIVYPRQQKMGLKRKAYILGDRYQILSISLKQTAEEDPNQYFTFKYFEKRKEGLEWLSTFED